MSLGNFNGTKGLLYTHTPHSHLRDKLTPSGRLRWGILSPTSGSLRLVAILKVPELRGERCVVGETEEITFKWRMAILLQRASLAAILTSSFN